MLWFFSLGARTVLRPKLPTRGPPALTESVVSGCHNAAPPAALSSERDFVDTLNGATTFGRIELPTSVSIPASTLPGSEPFKMVNGVPLWKVVNVLTCHPPRICPTAPACSRYKGTSHTKLAVKRWGRS